MKFDNSHLLRESQQARHPFLLLVTVQAIHPSFANAPSFSLLQIAQGLIRE